MTSDPQCERPVFTITVRELTDTGGWVQTSCHRYQRDELAAPLRSQIWPPCECPRCTRGPTNT
ncbi:hypothetical protein [Streptacidiphilus sp. MAP5-52]|uniref:hypothetical protein n=1 Tax=Streptacidiphilus sp. MAP5-52 TaxID=3156267 RepID=UPI00351855DC